MVLGKCARLAAVAALCTAVGTLGYLAGKVDGPRESEKPPQPQNAYENEDWNRALAEGRLALRDLDGNSREELVYFPKKGPPMIFEEINGSYTAENPLNTALYQSAAKLAATLAGDYSAATKAELVRRLNEETPLALRPLAAYAVLSDPSIALICGSRLLPGNAAMPLVARLYSVNSPADLLLLGPEKLTAITLAAFAQTVLDQYRIAYTSPPSYAQWTKSGPEWQDVGTVDASGLVKVAPGAYVHISEKETLKYYQDLRNDPDVIWTPGGFIRQEYPTKYSSREEYYRAMEQEARQRAIQEQQRREFEQASRQNFQQAAKQVEQWNQQAGRQAQQFQQDVGKQLDNISKQMENIFKKK